jgi:hypothetical protein
MSGSDFEHYEGIDGRKRAPQGHHITIITSS